MKTAWLIIKRFGWDFWLFFSLRKLTLKYIMLPILFPDIYQIWGHLLTRRKMTFWLTALKLTSSYAKLKYSKDKSLVSKADWFLYEHKDDFTHSLAYVKSCYFILKRKAESDAEGEGETVEEDTLVILKSRFAFTAPWLWAVDLSFQLNGTFHSAQCWSWTPSLSFTIQKH